MNNCHCHDELPRDGSGQSGRCLKALDPSYAPIDGRSIEDLLVFAKRYAAQIRFYDIPGSKVDDDIPTEQVSWVEFFRRDMAVIAASISVFDTAKLKRDYDQNREQLELHPDAAALHALFQPVIGVIVQLDRWYSIAIQENPLHFDLELAINSRLRNQVSKIVAYEEAYKYVDSKHPLHLDFTAIENDSLWGLDETVEPDTSVYHGIDLDGKIRSAALYVDDIFHVFYGFMTDLVEVKSPKYMQFALEAYPSHQPHMALFITFLELFRLAQEQLNGLTERMLSFYYNDVLHLAPKPSIPDRVHIVFELAKDIVGYDLAQGTSLKAGKDSSGKEQCYVTESDLVINQGKVKELKTIFIQKSPVVDPAKGILEGIYARPVANSLDGFGEAITDPSGKWPTFGKGSPDKQTAGNICQQIDQIKEFAYRKDQAQIGFAIASPQLLLQGGNRLITWKIAGLKDLMIPSKTGDTCDFEIWLTASTGWLKITKKLGELAVSLLEHANTFGIFNSRLASSSSGYYIDSDTDSLYIYLPVSENAIVPFDAKLHTGYSFTTTYPVVQIMLGPNLGIDYRLFTKLSLNSHAIAVRVGSINPSSAEMAGWEKQGLSKPDGLNSGYHFDGLKTLVLQNETALLSADKPFDPFTLYPGVGKSFYVGSDEVFNKPLLKLAIDIRKTQDVGVLWNIEKKEMTLALNLSDNFEYSLSLLDNKSWDQLSDESGITKFHGQLLTRNILNTSQKQDDGSVVGNPFPFPRTTIMPVTEFRSDTVRGFVKITNLQSADKTGNTTAIQASQDLAPELQIQEISVSYYSELTELDPLYDQFFHIYPFGVAELFIKQQNHPIQYLSENIQSLFSKKGKYQLSRKKKLVDTPDNANDHILVNADGRLLPQFTWLNSNTDYKSALSDSIKGEKKLSRKDLMAMFVMEASGVIESATGGNNQYSGSLQEEGMLFIGLEKVQPLDTLSLLFQFAEGSAEDEDNDPPEIHWSYLINNEWRPLKAESLISDSTFGFQTTGIIKFDVPGDSTDHNTIITDGLRWFCASVTENSNRIPMLVNIVAQAVEASFQDNGNDQSHFDNALAAGSISKLAVAVAQVSKVDQPFASFDGKHQEVGKEFYTRVSERLRHKARAVTPWDYEHLVLDRFPGIYKVKCITHTDPNCLCRKSDLVDSVTAADKVTCCGSQIAPGHVLIVPVANLQNRNAANPLQPKTSRRTLIEIEEYLGLHSSPFVHVHAKNPLYDQVLVFFNVQFTAGSDKGYYLKKLNDEIVQYLTPWAFDENADVSFAQKFYASAIVNFIEERSYVDFITDFLMFVCRDECCQTDTNAAVESDSAIPVKITELLSSISGCCDMEELIANQGNFIGAVIAEPSSSRSILVSAPQHIIMPYEAPAERSACQERRKSSVRAEAVTGDGIVKQEIKVSAQELAAVTVTTKTIVTPAKVKRRKK
ncbi:MAG: hypothetical protein HGB23_06415 [Chlorobiaceae bacterium]|nr:hypothetical protein [Chlorobiaceae bacterium]